MRHLKQLATLKIFDLICQCSFINDLSGKPPNPETDSKSVQDFLASMEITFKEHPLWAGATNEELESAGEVVIPLPNQPLKLSSTIFLYLLMLKISSTCTNI